MFHPLHRVVLNRRSKRVICTDFRGDTSDLTIYTFTNCHIGDLGSVYTGSTFAVGNDAATRSVGKHVIAVVVHSEDALTAWTVSSVTIGGVAGTSRVDRGGATVLISTAIFTWDTEALAGVGSVADIVVTFSEAVTSCAIGVLNIDNVQFANTIGTQSGQAAGSINLSGGPASANQEISPCQIIGASCVTGGGSELIQFSIGGAVSNTSSLPAPTLLYAGNTAEMDYAAAYTSSSFVSGAASSTDHYGISASWSGAGDGDAAMVIFG